MSSRRAPGQRLTHRAGGLASAARVVFVATFGLTLAGCGSSGFHPLHGPTASGESMDERLASVELAPIPGRVGQRIRNELVFQRDHGGSRTASSTERLEVTLTESIVSTLIDRTGTSGGQVYQLEARYRLVDTKNQKVLYEGRSLGRAGFERNESIYSNVRAREDAENRAARSIATDIKTRLAAYLSST